MMAIRDLIRKLTVLAWEGFQLSFGLISLASVYVGAVIKDGVLWASNTTEEKQELADAQAKHWSLDREPLPGFRHAFFKTSTQLSLHYVVNCPDGFITSKNVAIFIHGFPDSFLLWRHILQSPDLLRNYVLIAVDLPGYGGSDSLPAYGPFEVLETMAEFLIGMRNLYLQEDKRLVVATHDWGGVIGARLASEASQLADHWIVTSALVPRLCASNTFGQLRLCRQMFHTWIRSPLNLRLLKNSVHVLGPIASQFKKSFYIFCFLLPWPFTNMLATFGNYWFLRLLHSLTKGSPAKNEKNLLSKLNTKEAAEAMAMTTGPGPAQFGQIKDLKYGDSVRARMHDRGMGEKTRIYRESLFLGKWNKSLEITAALFELAAGEIESPHSSMSSGTLLNTAPKGAFKAPTTLILGQFDLAFDKRLGLNNVQDFLVKGCQVVLVKGGGHWLPLEPIGRRVLEKTIQWALQDRSNESEIEGTPFAAMSDVKIVEEM